MSDKPDRLVRIVLFGVQGEVLRQTDVMPARLAREVIELCIAFDETYGSGIEARDVEDSLTAPPPYPEWIAPLDCVALTWAGNAKDPKNS